MSVSPPPPPPPGAEATPLGPTTHREPILDALRGAAVLGILLINVQLMRGPEIYRALAGLGPDPAAATSTADRIVAGLLGWLAAGKFLSSFAILFGLGAALMVGRAVARGHRARPLLARRYAWLLVAGLAHMVLLFPGDILFLYGLTGMVLLAFVDVAPRTALRWAGGLLAAAAIFTVAGGAGSAALAPADPTADPVMGPFVELVARRAEVAEAAFTTGSYLDVVAVNAWQAAFVQLGQLVFLPITLALFLLGFAVGRAGWLDDLAARRAPLGRIAVVALPAGLVLSLGSALSGPIGTDGLAADRVMVDPAVAAAAGLGQVLGAPLLAVGYLAVATRWWQRRGAPGRLARLGRVAFSAYLSQSLLALVVFAGFSRYGQLGTASSLLVVVGIWAVLLVLWPWWVARFGPGPVERLWRRLTYGRTSGSASGRVSGG